MATTNIFSEAKKVRRKHPKLSWQECVKRAAKQGKKIGAAKKRKPVKRAASRQTGSSNKAADRKRVARPPGARKPAGSKVVTYYERRKNRSDVPGTLTGVSAASLTSELKKRLLDKESALVLRKYRATRKTDKRKIQKELTAVKAQQRKLSK